MNRKITIIVCALILVTGMALDFGLPADLISKQIGGVHRTLTGAFPAAGQLADGKADGGYRLTFDLDKAPRGVINCYMLKYRPENLELAWKYAKIFTDIQDFHESEDTYFFSGALGTVTIDKEINQIHYSASDAADDGAARLISDEEAIDKAFSFIGNRLLVLIYEEAQVHFDGQTYRVQFINRLSNLKNYAFTNEVRLDRCGRVLGLDYFTAQYDKVGGCRVKSMEDVYQELPALSGHETVLLESCQLVYIYQDSIIQPAYYFQGSATDNKNYECFIKAAVF